MLISELAKDMRFEGFLLVRSAEQRVSNANGSRYLDMTLCDRSGEVNAKVWDGLAAPPASGSVIKVRALMQEYNGRLQMRVEKMRAAKEDEYDVKELVRCAPEDPQDMMKEIRDTVDAMTWEDLKKIVNRMLLMTGDKLLYYPAAQRLHHAERSGLLEHTLSMLRVAKAVAPLYPKLNRDLLYAGVIIHDLSKTMELCSDQYGNVNDYSVPGMLLGHLVDGVGKIREAAAAVHVPTDSECVLLLSHMVISHHGLSEFGSPKPPMFPEAEALHMIDDLDAKMNEMLSVTERTPVGVFSEKIWSLDRRLYHPVYDGAQKEEIIRKEAEKAPLPFEDKPAETGKMRARASYDNLL